MISQIVAHADPVIRDWEIWNEPDSGYFFTGTPQQYARMLQTAHDAIKQIDPQANVLLGGMSSTSATSWLTQVFATPGVDPAHDFDIANVHERGPLGSLASDLGTWKRFLSGVGFSGPVWVTEHGYPSDPAYQYDLSYTAGADSQAAYLTASVPTLIDAGASQVLVTERDNVGGQYASEGVLGGDVLDPPVADPHVVEKPSYTALAALAGCYQASGHDCPDPPPAISPRSIAMPATRLGSSSQATITISDSGAQPLQIGSLAVAQESGSGISLQSDECSAQIIEPKQVCSVGVAFAPRTGGASTATIRIPSDQGAVNVSVSGVSPSVSSLTPPALAPRFEPISADGVGYGQRLVLVLSNPLSTPVYVADTSVSGADARQFAYPFSRCAGDTLGPGGSCRILVLFEPTRAGTAFARLTVTGDGLPLQIPLSATAFPLPRVTWIDATAGSRCLSPGTQRWVRVLVDQPSRVRWSLEPAPGGHGPRCTALARPSLSVRPTHSSAVGLSVTGQRPHTVFGHRGYLSRFPLPPTRGLKAGAYQLIVSPTSSHGPGQTKGILLAVAS
jgi:hypothetical protein